MTAQAATQASQPRCPNCGGESFSFKEVFGPPAAHEMVGACYESLATVESHVCDELLQLRRKLVHNLQNLESASKAKLEELEANKATAFDEICESVEHEITEAASEDEILGYIMGDDEKQDIAQRRQGAVSTKFEEQRKKLLEAYSVSSQELMRKARQLKAKLRAPLENSTAAFLQDAESYTLALVYCVQCGTPISACPSPRVSSGILSKQTQSLLVSIVEQQAAADKRAQDSMKHLESIRAGIVQANRLSIESTNSIVNALAHLAAATNNVRAATAISALAHTDQAVDAIVDGMGGGEE
ncbi:MAG: hypothetical protein RIC55_19070 [Pirellulaceae bacterium]